MLNGAKSAVASLVAMKAAPQITPRLNSSIQSRGLGVMRSAEPGLRQPVRRRARCDALAFGQLENMQ